MGYLDSFELVSDKSRPFITVRERSITFSKTAIELLHFSAYVHMYIDKKNKIVAFQETENDDDAIAFYRDPKEGRSVFIRISDTKKAQLILNLAETNPTENGLRIYGKHIEEEKLIAFKLSDIG